MLGRHREEATGDLKLLVGRSDDLCGPQQCRGIGRECLLFDGAMSGDCGE
jgi:hypothetical protein